MYSEIFKLRSCGVLRISTITRWKQSLSGIVKMLGLNPYKEDLEDELDLIDRGMALDIITQILWKDMAYGSELMSYERARDFAGRILEDHYTEDCKIYTNGDWLWTDVLEYKGGSPLTEATVDSGVIILHPKYCCCVWVEDED